jgi:hypothetical protein
MKSKWQIPVKAKEDQRRYRACLRLCKRYREPFPQALRHEMIHRMFNRPFTPIGLLVDELEDQFGVEPNPLVEP